jgi:hypothetical protein
MNMFLLFVVFVLLLKVKSERFFREPGDIIEANLKV